MYMNVSIWLKIIIIMVLATISILIFSGKGNFLIAGYNTLDKEEKDKYNIKTLGKVVGGGLGIITIITALIMLFNAELPSRLSWLNPCGILGTVAVMIILGRTVCKK